MIHIHIEELVLDGWPLAADQRATLREAVEQELAARFRADPPTPPTRSVPRIAAPAVELGPPDRLGRDLARAVHGSITDAPDFARPQAGGGAGPHHIAGPGGGVGGPHG